MYDVTEQPHVFIYSVGLDLTVSYPNGRWDICTYIHLYLNLLILIGPLILFKQMWNDHLHSADTLIYSLCFGIV